MGVATKGKKASQALGNVLLRKRLDTLSAQVQDLTKALEAEKGAKTDVREVKRQWESTLEKLMGERKEEKKARTTLEAAVSVRLDSLETGHTLSIFSAPTPYVRDG